MAQLSTLSNTQLLTKYNAAAARLGRPTVKRFADSKTAIRRTREILTASPDPADVEAKAPEPKAPRADLALTPPKSRRTKGFNFPLRRTLKKLNKGTIREAIFKRLAEGRDQGVTEQDVREVIVEWKRAHGEVPNMDRLAIDAYEHIRNLHLYVGYGMEQGQDGRIRILLPEAG